MVVRGILLLLRQTLSDNAAFDVYFMLQTISQLMAMNLPIPMSPDTDWILNENHVRLALRKVVRLRSFVYVYF